MFWTQNLKKIKRAFVGHAIEWVITVYSLVISTLTNLLQLRAQKNTHFFLNKSLHGIVSCHDLTLHNHKLWSNSVATVINWSNDQNYTHFLWLSPSHQPKLVWFCQYWKSVNHGVDWYDSVCGGWRHIKQ